MALYADILTKTREQIFRDLEDGIYFGGHFDPIGTTLHFIQLHHLDANEQAGSMLRLTVEVRDLTRAMRRLAAFVAVLTLVNVVLVAYTVPTIRHAITGIYRHEVGPGVQQPPTPRNSPEAMLSAAQETAVRVVRYVTANWSMILWWLFGPLLVALVATGVRFMVLRARGRAGP